MYNYILLCVYHSQGLHNLCLQNTHILALNSQVQCTRTFPTIHTQTMEYCTISRYRWVSCTHTCTHVQWSSKAVIYTQCRAPSTGSELVYTIGDVFPNYCSGVQVCGMFYGRKEGGGEIIRWCSKPTGSQYTTYTHTHVHMYTNSDTCTCMDTLIIFYAYA